MAATEEIRGIGHSVRRVEDDRFIRGAGNYIDDIHLPGMLHMAILRSPYAHANLKSVDGSRAQALDGVIAVVTGELMAQHNLAWMPTLSGDTQAVLATDKVRFQGQEVAAVIATDPYIAVDALELIDVDYEPLDPVTTPQRALESDAPVIRTDKEGQANNHIYDWETGDKAATDAAFAAADKIVSLDTFYPRCHPAPLETCGCIADVSPATGQVTIYMTSQAPHAIRTVFALVAGLPEEKIRIVSPDIGGGFGNKVPVYPGYVVATAASLLLGHPVKWIEDRSENLISTGFARDYHMHGELALKSDGTMLGLRASLLADEGAFYADAQPSKFKVGLFHIVSGSYDLPATHVTAEGAYTNKAPGGVAYRCSFRVTEASYLIERLVSNAAYELGMDPVELRKKNFIQKDQFPYTSSTGFVYDSGDYEGAMDKALEMIGYDDLRKEQAEARAQGKLYGIGVASFTEVVGAGPAKDYDIIGIKMNDGAELRVHPTGKAILKLSCQTQGQGHETTFAQIVAGELGIQPEDIKVMHGDTDNTPYGLGTYASRSTPTSGAATAMVARRVREKAMKLAAHLLEVAEEDIEYEAGKFSVKGAPDQVKSIQDVAFAAYTNFPEGMEAGLEGRLLLQPAEPDVPVRNVRRLGRGGPRHRRVEGATDDRGRRLRRPHQPDDRRGPDPGWAHGRVRDRRHGADHVRRGRQRHRHELHGLPDPDRVGDAEVRARRDGHAVTAPPDRRQGRRRIGDGRLAGRVRQRRDRRAVAVRCEEHRHAGHVREGLGGVGEGEGGHLRLKPDVLQLAAELSGRGEPFVLATVVWRRAPSSGKEGATALITPDRKVRGWLGGACAEPTVVREALKALEEGSPRLLFLGPPEELEGRARDGVVTVPIACQSEGALEVYVEPVLPQPQIVAIGRSPAAGALAALATGLGWRSVLVEDSADLGADVDERSYVVVATQGHFDEEALEHALATPAGYVGLVASRKRADAVLGYLRDRGVAEEALARVHAPAGLDLGHVATDEIAVAILAEIVQLRAAGALETGAVVETPARHEEIDPVCGMTVDVADARYRTVHDGRTYYFCSAGCLESFESDPARYVTVAP